MKLHRVLILLASLAFSPLAFTQTNPKGVAEINGQFITQDELNKAAADELKGLETKRLQNDAAMAQDKQDIMNKALEELVANKLIEAEAKKQNITFIRKCATGSPAAVKRFSACGNRSMSRSASSPNSLAISLVTSSVFCAGRNEAGLVNSRRRTSSRP